MQYIEPARWELNGWSPAEIKKIKALLADIRYSFAERDHDAFFYILYHGDPKRRYICMGIRKAEAQANGNPHSVLMAFGFFVAWMERQPASYVETMCDAAVTEYQRFLDGVWPIDKIHDQAMIDRIEEEDCLS